MPVVNWIRSGTAGTSALVLLAVLAAGCAVGPDYEDPDVPVPDAWDNALQEDLSADLSPLETWWTAFNDTLLNSLIVTAKEASPDLEAAVGRIREADAYRRIAGGTLWPQIKGNGAFNRVQVSENGPNGNAVAMGMENPSGNWEFGLGASWEIDMWGRLRRSLEAANANLSASIEDYRDVLVTLYANVASSYIRVRSLQERVGYAQDNADSQRETLELVEARLDAGLVPALDVARARSNLANTLSAIPSLETELEIERNRLAILLGQFPGSLDERLKWNLGVIPEPPTEFFNVLPVDLLRRRPDIRSSERQLAAQTARIGVATADLYPKFSLSGALGLQALNFDDLGQSQSLAWSLTPGFSWNLFTGGRVRGQIQAEEAKTDQALASYEKTVLQALAEVENAMVAVRNEEARVTNLTTAVEASQESVALVNTQYLSGLTDFQSYLDAQRSLTSQQDQLATSRGQVVDNFIILNRSLGGGWSLEDPIPTLTESPNPPGGESEEEVDR